MRQRSSPAPVKGQEQLSNLGGKDNSNSQKNIKQVPIGKNRLLVLESIAVKWANRGLYRSPSRAMIALLDGEL